MKKYLVYLIIILTSNLGLSDENENLVKSEIILDDQGNWEVSFCSNVQIGFLQSLGGVVVLAKLKKVSPIYKIGEKNDRRGSFEVLSILNDGGLGEETKKIRTVSVGGCLNLRLGDVFLLAINTEQPDLGFGVNNLDGEMVSGKLFTKLKELPEGKEIISILKRKWRGLSELSPSQISSLALIDPEGVLSGLILAMEAGELKFDGQ